MFERFTDQARGAIVLAQEEARVLNHNYIGTEHLLLGLVHSDSGVATQALASLGVDLSGVRREVEAVIGTGAGHPEGHIPFTPRAKKVLELSLREALDLGSDEIRPEHILLGLIREGEGVACQVLLRLGCEPRAARDKVIELTGATPGRVRSGPFARAAGHPAARLLGPEHDDVARRLDLVSAKLDAVVARVEAIARHLGIDTDRALVRRGPCHSHEHSGRRVCVSWTRQTRSSSRAHLSPQMPR